MSLVLILLSVALAAPATAHPHIFIDAAVRVVFDGDGAVTAIHHDWTFDEGFSAWSVQGLDTNGDGATSPDEMQQLADENMIGLAQYDFYTFAGEGSETLPLEAMGDAGMVHEDGHTTLSFSVRPQTPYRIADTLELAVNDPAYYVAITFSDLAKISLENAPPDCTTSLEPPRELAPELADQLYALPPEVTELPKELSAALRGVQGAILIRCNSGAAAPTALDAVTQVAETRPAPFGGPPAEPGIGLPRSGVFLWIAEQQRAFYAALTAALGALRQDNAAFWVLGGLSFLYGVLHAAGPGHGKVVLGSYMLASEAQLRRGVLLSFLSAMLQSLVAVGLVGVAAGLLGLASVAITNAANWIGILSYGLMVVLGLFLVARKMLGLGHVHAAAAVPMSELAHAHLHGSGAHAGHSHHDHDHHHSGGHDHHHVVTPQQAGGSWAEQLGVVLSVGLRPCSGALVVLVFALSQGVLPAGIAAVFLMGLGTFVTVALLASLAAGAKGLVGRIDRFDGALAASVLWWLELFGAVAVLAFGAVFLLASL